MNTTTLRQPTSFRLKPELLQVLKRRAQKSNRSLNNYVESVLWNAVFNEPNETTKAALHEAESLLKEYKDGKLTVEPIDLTNVETMLKSFDV